MAYTHPLDSDESLSACRAALTSAVLANETRQADEFCLFYEGFLTDNPRFALEQPEYATAYNEIYQQARWVALPRLRDEKDVLAMFGGQLSWLKKMPDFEVLDALKDHIKTLDVEQRDPRKNKIRDAMVQNKEVITPAFVAVANKLQKKGTVGDWVSEYLSFMGPEVNSALLLARFTAETDFSKQNKENQTFLRRLFAMIEYSRTSSVTPQGFEGGRLVDVDGNIVVYADGEISDLESDESLRAFRATMRESTLQSRQQALREAFVDSSEYASALTATQERLRQVTGGDAEKIRRALVSAVSPTQGKRAIREEVVSLLRMFIAQGALKDLFQERSVLDLVRAFLEKEKRSVDLDTFKVFPGAPQFERLLLQIVLQDTLGLSENDAAREALQIANILRRRGDDSLVDIAYFDDVQRTFTWKTPLRRVR